ncbi:MAG: hypothetical protein ACRDJJ_04390 [Actinomycetota bacterium]
MNKSISVYETAREIAQGFALLAVTGSSVGGFLGIAAIAVKALR